LQRRFKSIDARCGYQTQQVIEFSAIAEFAYHTSNEGSPADILPVERTARILSCVNRASLLANEPPDNSADKNRYEDEPKQPNQLLSAGGISLFVLVQPLLPNDFIE
jgi:hypothetical protein